MEILLGKTLEELQSVALSVGLQKFAGKQLADWLYVKRVTTFDEMTNLSLKSREVLKAQYAVGRSLPVATAESVDGTKKYLFEVQNAEDKVQSAKCKVQSARYVEAVFIPEEDRATLCVSTQAGCKMGCRFCMTGTLGFHGQLTAADILNQIFTVNALNSEALNGSEGAAKRGSATDKHDVLTNIVYMGEGEPMDNIDNVLRSLNIMCAPYACAWSPKRITVSSVGVIPGLKRLLSESDVHVAISLHNPFPEERREIMPAEKMYAIEEVVELLKQYDFSHQRRVSFEYICWGGVNDTMRHAKELLRLLSGLDCRINLIRFHAGVEQERPDDESRRFPGSNERQMVWMRDYLTEKGITTTIRRSRGEDILAACGMLVNALVNK